MYTTRQFVFNANESVWIFLFASPAYFCGNCSWLLLWSPIAIVYRTFRQIISSLWYCLEFRSFSCSYCHTERWTFGGPIAIINFGIRTNYSNYWGLVARKTGHYCSSWHVIPLIYGAVLGYLFQHYSFTAASGLFTLSAALLMLE